MDLGLTDRVVWITGASGGIGRALAEAFAAEGALLGLSGHSNAAELERWTAAQPWADRALVAPADVRSSAAQGAVADAIVARFGRLDHAIANAGVWPAEDRPLVDLDDARLADTLATNLSGALYTARAFLRALRATGPRPDGRGASLVFTGSTAARFGERGHLDYAVAKSGLVGAVRTLKNEVVALDPHGRVNLVQPGWTVTHMARPALDDDEAVARVTRTMALRQLARAKDIARTAVWLSSPTAARHVTGEVITVAGGMEGRLLWERDEVDVEAIRARLDVD